MFGKNGYQFGLVLNMRSLNMVNHFKIRVLIIAEAANPEWTSVPLVGWSHSAAIRSVADTHVVTQVRNKAAFERAGLTEGVEFTSIDSEKIAAPAYHIASLLSGGENKGWTILTAIGSLTYPYFERLVWQKFKDALCSGKYDIVHRITPLTPTSQSFLAKCCARIDVPFVVGPLNGGLPWPKGFDSVRRQEKEWLSYIRRVYKLLPGYNATLENASTIVAGSQSTFSEIPTKYHHKTIYIPENGINPLLFSKPEFGSKSFELPLKLAFVGRLVPYKGPDMLLEAVAPLLRSGQAQLDIYGDGPLMSQLQQMVIDLNITDKVKLWGFLEQSKLSLQLSQSHVLTFPSIREFGGGVVLEAMALGVVPIVIDYGGPAELTTSNTGYLISLNHREQIVRELRETIISICNDPAQLAEKSQRAVDRAFNLFTWEAKAFQMLEVYRWALDQRTEKPNFGKPLNDSLTTYTNSI
jgi:glycosyltransferase involved in cell wall biosynthesis